MWGGRGAPQMRGGGGTPDVIADTLAAVAPGRLLLARAGVAQHGVVPAHTLPHTLSLTHSNSHTLTHTLARAGVAQHGAVPAESGTVMYI